MLNKVKIFLLILIFLTLLFIGFLFSGIKINSISFDGVSASQLYIKLDKKLIVDINHLSFKPKKSAIKNSFDDIKTNIKKLPTLLKYFQRINIKKLTIKDNEFSIFFDKKKLYLDNKYINLSSKINTFKNNIVLNLNSLYLKDIKLFLKGGFKFDTTKGLVTFVGKYSHKNVKGELSFQGNKDFIDFHINSEAIKNIKFIKNFVTLPKSAQEWMYDNVTGEMKLNYLYGKLKTKTFEPIISEFKGNATIKNAKINFNKKAKVVKTEKLTIDYKNNNLIFNMEKPTYNKSKIYGSWVVINNLTNGQKGQVVVNIKTNSSLNNDILEILKAYDITLPLIQTKGFTNSHLKLVIPYLNNKIKATGNFIANDATFKLKNFQFFSKKAKIQLKNSHTVIIQNSQVTHKNIFKGILNLNINTNTSTAKGNVLFNKIFIKYNKYNLIDAKNIKSSIFIDFKKDTLINFDTLNTKLLVSKDNLNININKLSKIYPYSMLLKSLGAKKGDLNLNIKDKNNINFITNIKDFDSLFYTKGKQIKTLTFNGFIKNNNLQFYSTNKNIKVISNKEEVPKLYIQNIDLSIKNNKYNNNIFFDDPIQLNIKNSNIKFDNVQFFMKNSLINVTKNNVTFKGDVEKLELPLIKNNNNITSLNLKGFYNKKNKILNLNTNDKKLNIQLKNKKELTIHINSYDLAYNNSHKKLSKINNINIIAHNSNIIMNHKYKLLAKQYKIQINGEKEKLTLKNGDLFILYTKNDKEEIKLKADNLTDTFINTLVNKDLITGGKVTINAWGENEKIIGKIVLSETNIKNLTVLTNLMTLINTSPALINPLLAVPSIASMATHKGFTFKGYEVNNGYINFNYDMKSKLLNMTKIVTVGNGIDFNGKAHINMNTSIINGELDLIFFKGYSKLVGSLPILNYIFLGDKKRVETHLEITGTLDKPKIKSNIAKDSLNVPINILKRIITSPFKIFENK